MRKLLIGVIVLAMGAILGPIADPGLLAQVNSNDPRISIMDDCDPTAFPPGGCLLGSHEGDVTPAGFGALLHSPLYPTVVGHPSWRNEPSYLSVALGKTVKVKNDGGRVHTFTKVASFGGGFVPPLNGVGVPGKVPLIPAPECAPPPVSVLVVPGDSIEVKELAAGTYTYQCCIHPWMRATINVK